jgi:hypothetical protein
MVLGAVTGAYVPTLHAADVVPQPADPCGPLLTHLETLMPDGVVTPDVYAGEGLTGYLQREDREPRATLALASEACRADVRRDPSGRLPSFVRDALSRREPGWVNVGRVVACAVQDPAYLAAVPEWLADERHAEARAACFTTLWTWPGGEAIRPSAFGRAVRGDPPGAADEAKQSWYVDRALLSVIARPGDLRPEARDRLLPVLRAAEERRAIGYDSLRAGLCVAGEPWSGERARMCGDPSARSEAGWGEDRERVWRWSMRLGATVPYLGAVAVAYVRRDSDLGLGIATGAGALAGASVGILLGAWAALADADPDYVEVAVVLGAAVLGTLGGIAAHAAVDDSPEWRTPLTAGALLIPLTIVWGSAHRW